MAANTSEAGPPSDQPLNGRAIRIRGIHNCTDVENPLLDGLLGGNIPIGQSLAAFIEDNNARESGQTFQQMLGSSSLPTHFRVREGSRHQHDIARTVTEDPIREMNAVASGIFDRSFHCGLRCEEQSFATQCAVGKAVSSRQCSIQLHLDVPFYQHGQKWVLRPTQGQIALTWLLQKGEGIVPSTAVSKSVGSILACCIFTARSNRRALKKAMSWATR